jgi:hypothetical protein
MTDHADIVRNAITMSMSLTGMPGYSHEDWDGALAALDALVAERDESYPVIRGLHDKWRAAVAERDEARRDWAMYQHEVGDMLARAEAAEAEVARLKANALLAASNIDWCIGFAGASDNMKWGDMLTRKLREARAALASGSEGGNDD